MNEEMILSLRNMYANPTRSCCFYSANGAEVYSDRLKSLGFWDWTPEISLPVPDSNTCMFPLTMGCEPMVLDDGKLWIKPMISDPAQIKDIEIPDVWSGRTGMILRNIERMMGELQDGERIREPDIQSPLGVAELMWDESFYFAFYEAPDALHELLDKITRTIISFIRELKKLTGSRLNAAGFPLVWADENGTMIADDTMSLVSPGMHLEFSVPYVNRIADECGPLFYHSCTWRKPYFDNIHQIKNVKAYNWNPGNSDDPADIISEFSGRAVLAPHLCKEMHRDGDVLKFCREKGLNFADEFDFFKHMAESMKDNTSLYFWLSNIRENGAVMENIYDWCARRGWTPEAYS